MEAAAAAAAPTLVLLPAYDYTPVRALYVTAFQSNGIVALSQMQKFKGKLYLPYVTGIQ